MGFYFNEDNRVHLNLSNYAWNVLYEDMFNFCRDSIENYSGFINDIFLNFYQDARASVQIRCDSISTTYDELLSEDKLKAKIDPSIYYSIIDVVVGSYKVDVAKTIKSYPKESYKKIKLRKQVVEILEDSSEDVYYDGNVGSYIKAVIEEYARLPFLQRESIICKVNYELINKAISSRKQIKIIVRSGKEFEIIPYKVIPDKLGMYNYLVGIDSSSKQPVSYRVSKAKMKVTSKSGKITRDEEKLILDKLLEVDVSFLTKEVIKVIVQLDKYGVQKYNSQMHMRPNFIDIIDGDKYVFNCSIDQIKFYFLKFGSSAKVLEPESLARSFYGFYKYALSRYEDDSRHN